MTTNKEHKNRTQGDGSSVFQEILTTQENRPLVLREMVFEPTDNYFNAYDEVLESNPSD